MTDPLGLLLVGGLLALGGVLIGKGLARPVVLNLDNSTHEQVFVAADEDEYPDESQYVAVDDDDDDEDEDDDQDDDGEGWKRGRRYPY